MAPSVGVVRLVAIVVVLALGFLLYAFLDNRRSISGGTNKNQEVSGEDQ